jgi:LPS O-antigen subunit length determinant protein (WzzB/FepE family)
MATTRRRFIIATLILACAAVALLVTSLATSSWVEATLSEPDDFNQANKINYGLFVGHIEGYRNTIIHKKLELSSKGLPVYQNR